MKTSIVAFLDFLGYRSLISSLGEDPKKLKTELDRLKAAINDAETYLKMESFEYKFFTDNLVVSTEIEAFDLGEGPLGNILGALAIYQLAISSHGYFIRGGIEAGYNYIDEKVVFGNALITAYNLESKCAVFPRILVGPKLQSLIERHKKWYPNVEKMPHNDVLNLASTELFIDYLKGSLTYCEDDYTSIYPLVEKHKTNIEKALKQHQSNYKVLNKYIWLKNYHNNFCNLESAFKKLIIQ